MAKIISIYGPPNSGKTTLAVVVSEVLAQKGYNTCMVCCDNMTPTIPVLLPQTVNKVGDTPDKIRSVGKILNCIEFSTNDILMQAVYSKRFSRIILLGYAFGENKNSYPTPTEYDVYSLYGKLSDMVDYIVIDAGGDLTNPLCKVGIEHSDNVIRVAGSGYKDITFYASNFSLIPEGEVKKDEHIVVFPKVEKRDLVDGLSDFYGSVDYTMKYNPEISRMMQYGEYFVKDFPSSYTGTVKKILEDVNFS